MNMGPGRQLPTAERRPGSYGPGRAALVPGDGALGIDVAERREHGRVVSSERR